MEPTLKQVWAELLDPADYDLHMSNVGQAEANAHLLRELLLEVPAGKLLIAGAGTGSMLEYVDPSYLDRFEVTFTDISERLLTPLKQRLAKTSLRNVHVRQDDVENTLLEPGFNVAAFVLVLEHVDWKRALDQALTLGVRQFVTIVQENPSSQARMASVHRELPGTVGKYADTPGSHLIDRLELESYLVEKGFRLEKHRPVSVPDGKTMHGLIFNAG